MKVVTIAGIQGSGKTTLIRELIPSLKLMGKNSAVIVNEQGKADFDESFLETHQVYIDRIRGGWIGCTLAGSLALLIKKIRRDLNPDFLFIEPFELVITDEIRVATSLGLRDVGYEIGPFIALVDAESFDFSWQERSKLILNHIVGADVVAISRSDLTKLEQVEAIRETLEDHVENNRVLSLSTVLGRGIKEVMDRILVR